MGTRRIIVSGWGLVVNAIQDAHGGTIEKLMGAELYVVFRKVTPGDNGFWVPDIHSQLVAASELSLSYPFIAVRDQSITERCVEKLRSMYPDCKWRYIVFRLDDPRLRLLAPGAEQGTWKTVREPSESDWQKDEPVDTQCETGIDVVNPLKGY